VERPGDCQLNPGGKLPDLPIKVLHRTDGKANYIFSDFLSKLSQNSEPSRKECSPKWPVGAAFSRCEDLLANAAKTSGAIGYVELRCGEKSGYRSREFVTLLESL